MADQQCKAHLCKFCGSQFSRTAPGVRNNAQFCSVECRFWAKVDKSGGEDACWLWTAARTVFGYGSFGIDGTIERSHRFAYQLTFGPIPDRLCVCHKCDNPACCNPTHYFLGTHQENMIDMQSKGRNKMTPEGLERSKAAKRGKPRPPEVREKLSSALRGRKMPADLVLRIADANRGGKRSEATKAKMRAAWEIRKARQAEGSAS